ncbi:hypothetical protein GQX73_g10003 [Xylaria multiplex]|uniref:Uncharacterized protein n=1 Tax=Xylaria multiplex TaxID=323545 RepID=A0A7C8MM67_9PEZI|nr:hypothetical protein GQX73_g10003 [Xylaria multiplex]
MDREDTTTKDKRIAELALIKQQLYKVSSDLQDAQQQIEEMEDHMERCPMARKSEEFYEHHNRKAELLADDIEETRQSIVSFTTQAV